MTIVMIPDDVDKIMAANTAYMEALNTLENVYKQVMAYNIGITLEEVASMSTAMSVVLQSGRFLIPLMQSIEQLGRMSGGVNGSL